MKRSFSTLKGMIIIFIDDKRIRYIKDSSKKETYEEKEDIVIRFMSKSIL